MGLSVSTVKIFSAFQKLVSVHSSSSLIRTAMELSRCSSRPRAPTSPELCNKVPRGSRRKPRQPLRECISYVRYLCTQHQPYCVASASPWRSLALVLSLKTTFSHSSLSTPHFRSRHRRTRSVRHCVVLRFNAAHSARGHPALFTGQSPGSFGTGVSDQQRQSAYSTWLQGR